MKIELSHNEDGYPKTFHIYENSTVPEIGSWIALGSGFGGAFPTWRVIKVIHIPDLDIVKIQVSGS